MKNVFPPQKASKIFGKRKPLSKILTLRVFEHEIELMHTAFSKAKTTDFKNLSEYFEVKDLVKDLKSKMDKELFKEQSPFVIHPFSIEDIGRISFILDLHVKHHIAISNNTICRKNKALATIAELNNTIAQTIIEYLKISES